jgi:4-hydroxyphenylpyruvate dioxygenase
MPFPTERFLLAAARAGFRDVELRFSRVWETLDLRPARKLRSLLADLGLRATALNSLEEFSLVPEENLGLMDRRAEAMFETCRLLDVGVLIVVPSRLQVPLASPEIRALTVDRLRRVALAAAAYGVTLAFEPIGTPGYSVRTTAEALSIVDEVGIDSVTLAVDTMNAYLGGDGPEVWAQIPSDRLAIVHFHDSEPGPLERLTLGSRELPGSGVIDLHGYAAALRKIKYDGVLSVELFNERIWAMDPDDGARVVMASLAPFLA